MPAGSGIIVRVDDRCDEWDKAFCCFARHETESEGFESLTELTRPILLIYLGFRDRLSEDHEDIVGTLFAKVWEHRRRISFSARAHWLSYVKTSADRLLIDTRSSAASRRTSSIDFLEDIPDNTDGHFGRALERSILSTKISEEADILWLGAKSADYDVRLLAATLLFMDGKELHVIMKAFSKLKVGPNQTNPIEFLTWISDITVLRSLTAKELIISFEDLLPFLLKCQPGDVSSVLHQMRLESRDSEVTVLFLRFGNFLTKYRINQKMSDVLTEEEVTQILEKYELRLPHVTNMRRLWGAFDSCDSRENALAKSGLWKRVVFHYSVLYDLRNVDFIEWISPAADISGFRIDSMKMHAWVSSGRLLGEFRRHLEKQGGDNHGWL